MNRLLSVLSALALGLLARLPQGIAAGEPVAKPKPKATSKAPTAPKAKPAAKPAPKAAPKAAPKGAPKGTPPAKGGPAEEGEGAEGGTASVLPDTDAVILRDGTRINGTVLCAGQEAVTILTKDGDKTVEQTIPREKIERVIKNADGEFPQKFATEEQDGHKYLSEEVANEAGDGEGEPGEGPPPAAPRKAAPKGGTKAGPPAAKGAPAPSTPPGAPKLPGGFQLPPGLKLPPGMKLPQDPAQLKSLLDRLQKSGALDKLLQDPALRGALEKAKKG